jgi:hypothetical protein
MHSLGETAIFGGVGLTNVTINYLLTNAIKNRPTDADGFG